MFHQMFNPHLHAIVLAAGSFGLAQNPIGIPHESAIQSGAGGGFIQENQGPCVCDSDHHQLMSAIAGVPYSGTQRGTRPYSFYPMGGKLWEDVFINNFVDLDSSASQIQDWDCTNYTYNGHDASDANIRTFEEQDIGVPVFSALDGVVIATHDGEPDKNTSWNGQPANYVAVNHGNGQVCYYYHFKKDSVAVAVGEAVVAGQQIGQIGSSGNSSGPHLHFSTYDLGQVVEPWAGNCRPGASLWEDQIPIEREARVMDFAVSDVRPDVNGGMPFEMPRSGYVELYQPAYLWYTVTSLPAFSTWQLDYVNPSGNVVYSSGTQAHNNSTPWRGTWWWRWYHGGSFNNVVGQWSMHLYINGALMVEAPYEVVSSSDPKPNREPEPVEISVGPVTPSAEGVFTCNAQSLAALDDPDYDVLQLRYIWQVNGTVVRDEITAALSDVIPSAWATTGDHVQCSVSVGDGDLFLDPVADGLVVGQPAVRVSIPSPVELGQMNQLHIEGGQPQTEYTLVFGTNQGWRGIPGCPGMGVNIQNPKVGPSVTTDLQGEANFDVFVPNSAQGKTFLLQAVSQAACETSNFLNHRL
jgi:hypothetical protein